MSLFLIAPCDFSLKLYVVFALWPLQLFGKCFNDFAARQHVFLSIKLQLLFYCKAVHDVTVNFILGLPEASLG